ncbi:OmpA family protein [Wenyingzhuangia sp. IMCC45574]
MKRLLLVAFAILTFGSAKAQDEIRPWAIGVGINTVDISPSGVSDIGDQIFNDYIGPFKDTNTIPVLSRIYVSRYLNKNFTLDFAFAYNSIKKQYSEEELVDSHSYLSGDLGLRYDLNNVIGDTKWFDPYAKLGLGLLLTTGDDLAAPASLGLGFNTWFNDKVGLNFETSYKSSAHLDGVEILGVEDLGTAGKVGDYHFQHSISLVYKFGAKDTDKDGTPDKEDLCPEIAGSKEFFGCPDTDGDGIVDKDDQCPKLAGSARTKGCPDTDKDGVADKDDACPNVKGLKALQGCPDSDNDGVADKDDACPAVAGTVETKGCPDADGDGIADAEDRCPEVVGTKEFGGCNEPELLALGTPGTTPTKGELIKTVEFKFGAYTFKLGVKDQLNEVVKLLDEEKIAGLYVEGHTDSAGPAAYNVKLSKKRAQAVVDYLVAKGIDESKLIILGFGETQPKSSNRTSKGRAENRRVEISIIEVKKN